MRREKRVYGIITVLFILMMLCKVSAFHVYTHDSDAPDEIENCSICDVAVKNQHSELNLPTFYKVNTPLQAIPTDENNAITFVRFHNRLPLYDHNSRPPPFPV